MSCIPSAIRRVGGKSPQARDFSCAQRSRIAFGDRFAASSGTSLHSVKIAVERAGWKRHVTVPGDRDAMNQTEGQTPTPSGTVTLRFRKECTEKGGGHRLDPLRTVLTTVPAALIREWSMKITTQERFGERTRCWEVGRNGNARQRQIRRAIRGNPSAKITFRIY